MDFLPATRLAKWQLMVAVTAVFNSVQNYVTLNMTRRLYNGASQQVTPLQARTFGAWTLLAAVVRGHAAYNIHDKTIYDIALLSYLIAFLHFSTEILFYKTAKPGPVLTTVATATISMIWMVWEYENYVKVD